MAKNQLSDTERAAVKGLLAAEHERTSALAAALARDFDEIVAGSETANLDDEHDPEGATIAFERAQVVALLSQARAHLADLDESSKRLSTNTSGICAGCGNRISIERLAARPTARTCVACTATRPRRS
ncbi:MAG: TraR/DksA family transcriptional regulator [Acidimicrobiia bacterium]